MPNDRIFYACQAVLVGSNFLSGVQSVGVNTNTPSQNLFDPGRAQQKYHFYDQQEIEITISRVIDQGETFFFPSSSVSLVDNANLHAGGTSLKEYEIGLIYSSDAFSRVGDTGNDKLLTTFRNCLISNISYDISVGGSVVESVTLITRRRDKGTTISATLPTEAESGNTIKWHDVDIVSSTLPSEVSSMFDLSNTLDGIKIYGLQSINIEVSIDYQELLDVGQRPGVNNQTNQNLWRYMNLPVGVSASFTGITRQNYPATITNSGAEFDDSRTISITAPKQNGSTFTWNLGTKNYVADISTSGGDGGGENVQTTISYQNNYNEAMFTKS
jgi:hypothetical protein